MLPNDDEKLGRAFRQLLTGRGTIMLSWDSRARELEADLAHGSRRHFQADGPLLLVQTILGTIPAKVCNACRQQKPLTSFARAGESEEARAPDCFACER